MTNKMTNKEAYELAMAEHLMTAASMGEFFVAPAYDPDEEYIAEAAAFLVEPIERVPDDA